MKDANRLVRRRCQGRVGALYDASQEHQRRWRIWQGAHDGKQGGRNDELEVVCALVNVHEVNTNKSISVSPALVLSALGCSISS